MIIISRSKKTIQPKSRAYSNAFGEKLMYIANPDKTSEVGIDHNLVSQPHDLRSIEQEFIKNYEQYHNKYNNRVVMYHEWISFSPKDREVLLQNRAILEDIARKWLEIRAPNAL